MNPQEHEAQGIPDLVNRSVLTTRRFDALKLWMTLQAHGREGLSAMIDATCELARLAAAHIDEVDRINTHIRAHLFEAGEAVIGVTRVAGRVCLKLTRLNPTTRAAEVCALIDRIAAVGDAITERGARPTCATTAR